MAKKPEPKQGDRLRGKDIGKKAKDHLFEWVVCPACEKSRWVQVQGDKPVSSQCNCHGQAKKRKDKRQEALDRAAAKPPASIKDIGLARMREAYTVGWLNLETGKSVLKPSIRQVADRFGVRYETLRKQASEEKWHDKRKRGDLLENNVEVLRALILDQYVADHKRSMARIDELEALFDQQLAEGTVKVTLPAMISIMQLRERLNRRVLELSAARQKTHSDQLINLGIAIRLEDAKDSKSSIEGVAIQIPESV